MKIWVTQLRKGLVEFLLLSVLRREETYGYEIVRRLQTIEELAVTESTVYPVLARLCSEGHLKVRTMPSSDGPPRRYFSLTATGRARLAAMNSYWQSLITSIDKISSLDSDR